MSADDEKHLVAHAGAQLVRHGMRVGLGSGSTVSCLLIELAQRSLDCIYVAASRRTEEEALALGLTVAPFDSIDHLDLALDGADQVAGDGWLNKGRGAAHTREKIVASAADTFVVLVDSSKLVDALHGPVPLELMSFGLSNTLARLSPSEVRAAPRSPDGGVIADYRGEVGDPGALAARLSSTPGVVGHGLFAPSMVSQVIAGIGTSIRSITNGGG